MNTFISMLRGINVSGQKKMRMPELKSLYESLGFAHVRTYVQSGNVIFDSTEEDFVNLAELIETQIVQFFGYAVSVFIRGMDDFQRIIDSNPFLHERNEDPASLHVTFLYRAPSESVLSQLVIRTNEADEFILGDKEIYIFCPNGYGRTKFSNNYFERKLNLPATTRNWNSVVALFQIANEGS
jgi:uncharacterized protein (DUF1697 family)